MGQSGSARPASACEALAVSSGSQRQRHVRSLAEKHKDLDGQDFYGLYSLRRYQATSDETTRRAIQRSFRALCLYWHPDKNPADKKGLCEAMIAQTSMGREVLLNPDLKRRYDIELRKLHGEWSSCEWYIKFGVSVLCGLGGLAVVIAGAAGVAAAAPVTVGAVGYGLLFGGIKGSMKMYQDPHCSTTELVKDLAVGGVQGATGGALAAAAMPAIAAASAGGQLGYAAAVGAGTCATGHVLSDAADLAISGGLLGEHVRRNVSDAKTSSEVFSRDNAVRLVAGTALGACAGMAAQGCANSTLIEDFALSVMPAAKVGQQALGLLVGVGRKALGPGCRMLVTFFGGFGIEVGIGHAHGEAPGEVFRRLYLSCSKSLPVSAAVWAELKKLNIELAKGIGGVVPGGEGAHPRRLGLVEQTGDQALGLREWLGESRECSVFTTEETAGKLMEAAAQKLIGGPDGLSAKLEQALNTLQAAAPRDAGAEFEEVARAIFRMHEVVVDLPRGSAISAMHDGGKLHHRPCARVCVVFDVEPLLAEGALETHVELVTAYPAPQAPSAAGAPWTEMRAAGAPLERLADITLCAREALRCAMAEAATAAAGPAGVAPAAPQTVVWLGPCRAHGVALDVDDRGAEPHRLEAAQAQAAR